MLMFGNKFTTEITERTGEDGKTITTYRSGFKGLKGFKGFVWTREVGPSPYPEHYNYSISCHWGIAGQENDLRTSDSGLMEDPGDMPLFGHYYFSEYKPFPENLKRFGPPSSPEYIGEHKDYAPHGLGSWFYHNSHQCAELPGLWEKGELTHILVCGTLVPDGKPATKEQAVAMAKIYERIARVCEGPDGDEELAIEFYLKAAEVTAPFDNDPVLLEERAERYLALRRLTGGYGSIASELKRKAIELRTDKTEKAEAIWRLFLCDRENHLLQEFLEAGPKDHLRQYIAHKTLGHQEEAQMHLNALIGSFGMEFKDGKTPSFKAGFRENGSFTGLVWEKVYRGRGGNSCDITFGRNGEAGIDILDWPPEDIPMGPEAKYFNPDRTLRTEDLLESAWYPAVIMLEETSLETFCGMHCGGVRNGLGSVFFFSRETGGTMSELQGLWQDGKITHIRSGEKLIPLDGPLSREDAVSLLKIYKNIADASAPETSAIYYGKAYETGLLITRPSPEVLEILADICNHIPGKEDEYVTYGFAAGLFWELFEFLDGKNDSRGDEALRRYLDTPDQDPEKRLLAMRRLHLEDMEEEAFFETFGSDFWHNEYTMDHGDFDCEASMAVEGFLSGGKFYGYAWLDYYDTGHPLAGDPTRSFSCGLLSEEYRERSSLEAYVPDLKCGVYYKTGEEGYTRVYGEPSDGLLIEKDADGRVLFCGMASPEGLRHGLGTEFHYEDGVLRSLLRGYWKDGKLFRKVDGGKLV